MAAFEKDLTYAKIAAADFSVTATTLEQTGQDETVLVIDTDTGAMTVYEYFSYPGVSTKWWQSTPTYTP